MMIKKGFIFFILFIALITVVIGGDNSSQINENQDVKEVILDNIHENQDLISKNFSENLQEDNKNQESDVNVSDASNIETNISQEKKSEEENKTNIDENLNNTNELYKNVSFNQENISLDIENLEVERNISLDLNDSHKVGGGEMEGDDENIKGTGIENEIKEEINGSGTENETYIDLDNLNNKSDENSTKKEKKGELILYKNGKKEIELVAEDKEIKIKKLEVEKEGKKEIKIESENHIEEPLRVYSNLPKEAEKKEIRIFWKNKGIEITGKEEFGIEYYDENENGLIDRVSWIVPHLSTQIFEIIIEKNKGGEGENITLKVEAPEGEVNNPINFGVYINYSYYENLTCVFKLNNKIENLELKNNKTNLTLNLENGNYYWNITCKDLERNKTSSKIGNFSVNETFYVSSPEKVYLKEKEDVNLKIKSKQGKINILLRDPNNFTIINQTFNASEINYTILSTNLTKIGLYKVIVGFYRLKETVVIERNFSVASMSLDFDNDDIGVGEEISFNINISSPVEKISVYELKFGDGESKIETFWPYVNSVTKTITHSYNSSGDFTLNLTAIIDGKLFSFTKNGVEVINKKDTESPEIDLIYPEDNAIINKDSITFEFKASDNVKLSNCTFSLYNSSDNFLELIYQKTYSDVKNNELIKVPMVDFEKRDYYWDVECYDNSSNYDWKGNFFSVGNAPENVSSEAQNNEEEVNESYERQGEVNYLLDKINEFIEKREIFNIDEKEAVDDLGLMEDLEFYKKRLLQIDQDLKHNIKFITSEDLKEKRIKELNEEIDNISSEVPLDIEVIETKEYIKNSLDIDMEEVVRDYMESTNTKISDKEVRKIADFNKELQRYIGVETKVRNIEIVYNKSVEKIILVTKKINLKNSSYDKILEVIPKEIVDNSDEIQFITKGKVIKKDPIIEFSYDNLDNGKIVYYLNKDLNLGELEKTQTIIFEESLGKANVKITGFFIFEGFDESPVFYGILVLLLIVFIYLISFIFGKFKFERWSKEPNAVRALEIIKDSKFAIRENDLERARENYKRLREIYPLLPSSSKKYFYKKIKGLMIAIDKRDIFNLVREYEQAKREFRREDSMRIYEDIKKIYKRLPKKDQEVVYRRVFSNSFYF